MHQCPFCGYQSSRNYNLKVHVKNKHSNHNAPTNTHLQPEVVHSSTEIPQHVTGYREPMKGSWITTQQFDPSSIPQIQYNEKNHQGYDPQTSTNYSVNPANEDTDTETVSEADTEDQEEYNIYEILNDIHLAFDHLKDLREQYRKALPQLKQLDEEEMDKFLYKYAELKIDIIDEEDGLEGKKVQTGSGLDDEYEGDTDEEAVDDDEDTDEEVVDEEGDTDEEAVDDEEAMDEEEEGKDVVDGEKVMFKGCSKERFFDFIFEAEEFMTPDSHKKRLHYEKIFREDIKEVIEKDESDKAENVDEMIEDVEHLRNEFDEDGNICFKYCSKRKINSISDMVDALLDNELGDDLKKSNPRKFKYIKELLKPYRNSIRKLRDPAVDIHEKRKVLQKPMVGEGVLDSLESVVTPMLKKKRC